MMRVVRCLVALAILLVAVTVAASDAPMPTGDQPVLFRDDSRLQAKVTLKLKCEPLSLFAETLSKTTGVTIRVRKDIADKNVTVFTKDMPCGEAMTRMAQVLGYVWEYTGDTVRKRSYVLVRPLKKKKEAEDLRQAEWAKKDQQFKDAVEDGIKLVDADKSAWQKAFDKNPAQAAEDVMFRDTLRALGSFTKSQRDDIWARIAAPPQSETRIPFTELPPTLQKQLRDGVDKAHESWPQDRASSEGIEQHYLIIARGGYGSGGISGMPPATVITFFGLNGYGGSAGLGFREKEAFIWDDDLAGLRAIGVDTSSFRAPSRDFSEPDSRTKRVPIKFEPRPENSPRRFGHSFAEILEAASTMFDVSIFADDYLCRHRSGRSPRTTFPDNADGAIGELKREFGYKDAFTGKSIGLHCETWYMDEPCEAPKRFVLQWTAAKKRQKRLQLKDYLDIVRKLDNMQVLGMT